MSFSNESVHAIALKEVQTRQALIQFIQKAIVYDHQYYHFEFKVNKIDQYLTISAHLNQPKSFSDPNALLEWLERCYVEIKTKIDQLIDPDQDQSFQPQLSDEQEPVLISKDFSLKFETKLLDAVEPIVKKLRQQENEIKLLKQQLNLTTDQIESPPPENDWGIDVGPKQSIIDQIVATFRTVVQAIRKEQEAKFAQINYEFQQVKTKQLAMENRLVKQKQIKKGYHR